MNASLPAPPETILDAVMSLSHTALLVYQPLRDVDGEPVDFSLVRCNPAARHLLAPQAAPIFRAHVEATAPNDSFAQLQEAFHSSQISTSLELHYLVDNRPTAFQAEVQRVGEVLVVKLTVVNAYSVDEVSRSTGSFCSFAYESRFLYDVLAHAPVAVATLEGADHVFTYMNPGYAQLLGGRPVLGLPVRQAIPDLNNQAFPGLLDQVYRTDEPFVGHEMLVQYDRTYTGRIDDTYFNFLYQATRDADGRITGVILFAYDMTDTVSWCDADEAMLSVADNGLGIDLQRQTELFGMFRRYHAHVAGAGVGLYMVKRMVEHIGGRISVHSQPGVGSTFTVHLSLGTT